MVLMLVDKRQEIDDFKDTEVVTGLGYCLICKNNLVSAFVALHRASGCNGQLKFLELEKHIKVVWRFHVQSVNFIKCTVQRPHLFLQMSGMIVRT